MEYKTKITADSDRQELFINRTFDLPVELLFKAYTEKDLIEAWMGNKVIKHESRSGGSYEFENRNPKGDLLFKTTGVIHSLEPNTKIVRTFEMINAGFTVQLEILEFRKEEADRSSLAIQIIYKSIEDRDAMLKLPFEYGINRAHNKLQETLNNLN